MLVEHPDGTLLTVWVVPGAAQTAVVGPHGDALKVRVAAPAEAGRANRAMLSSLSDSLGVDCRLVSGASSRTKRVVVPGLQPQDVAAQFGIGPVPGPIDEEARR